MTLRNLRTLVIEDEASIRMAITHVLKDFGAVEQAEDGLSGLNAFRQALVDGVPFHLVTIDLHLPQLDGQALLECMRGLEAVRRERIKAKCVMLTGETSRDVILGALRSGADSYLCKPVQPDELRKRVREIFGIPPPIGEARSLPVRKVG